MYNVTVPRSGPPSPCSPVLTASRSMGHLLQRRPSSYKVHMVEAGNTGTAAGCKGSWKSHHFLATVAPCAPSSGAAPHLGSRAFYHLTPPLTAVSIGALRSASIGALPSVPLPLRLPIPSSPLPSAFSPQHSHQASESRHLAAPMPVLPQVLSSSNSSFLRAGAPLRQVLKKRGKQERREREKRLSPERAGAPQRQVSHPYLTHTPLSPLSLSPDLSLPYLPHPHLTPISHTHLSHTPLTHTPSSLHMSHTPCCPCMTHAVYPRDSTPPTHPIDPLLDLTSRYGCTAGCCSCWCSSPVGLGTRLYTG